MPLLSIAQMLRHKFYNESKYSISDIIISSDKSVIRMIGYEMTGVFSIDDSDEILGDYQFVLAHNRQRLKITQPIQKAPKVSYNVGIFVFEY